MPDKPQRQVLLAVAFVKVNDKLHRFGVKSKFNSVMLRKDFSNKWYQLMLKSRFGRRQFHRCTSKSFSVLCVSIFRFMDKINFL